MKHLGLSILDYALIAALNSLVVVSIYLLRDGLTLSALTTGIISGDTSLVFMVDWVIALFLCSCTYLGARALVKVWWRGVR